MLRLNQSACWRGQDASPARLPESAVVLAHDSGRADGKVLHRPQPGSSGRPKRLQLVGAANADESLVAWAGEIAAIVR